MVKFVPEDSLYIHSDIVSDGDSDVLQEIFNGNSVPLSNAVYQCFDVQGYSKALRTNKSNIYWFALNDENGKRIDLNGLNMVFTLLLFKRDNMSDLLKAFMKMQMAQ